LDTQVSNRIGGVMVSVLALNVVENGFKPRSGQTKDSIAASPLKLNIQL
jgi:hypothetical protein